MQAVSAKDYPGALVRVVSKAPAGPWMYTGALENHPALVERISQARPLWGNRANVLAIVRAPLAVARMLQAADIPCPAVCLRAADLPGQGRWLIKPLASAGGADIAFLDVAPGQVAARKRYFQEYIEGEPVSASFVAGDREAVLLGVTRQLVGEEWLHAGPFHYSGSIGPISITPSLRRRFERLGSTLARGAGLRGPFGVDCILRGDVPWPVEFNPRYTASMEVLEYALRAPVLRWRRSEFRALAATPVPHDIEMIGKAILFARSELTFPEDGPWKSVLEKPRNIEDLPPFADIPVAGQRITQGAPVLTFFVRGKTVDGCRECLRAIAHDLDRCLHGA
jgi:predicted ATP-grasp superfamily ATP-dependent carboligase